MWRHNKENGKNVRTVNNINILLVLPQTLAEQGMHQALPFLI
jgi:hypothetical protein